jgi:outer membrane protein assembly factor BamB
VTRLRVAAVIALTLMGSACSGAAGVTRKAGKGVVPVERHRDRPAQSLGVAESTRVSGQPGGVAIDAAGSVVELDEKTVVAYDTEGLERWSLPVPGAALGWPWIGHGLVVIPTLSAADLGESSGAGDSGGCVAIDRVTGERRWSYAEQGRGGVAVGGMGALVFCAFGDGVIAALDVDSGSVVWRAVLAPKFASRISVSERTAIAVDRMTGTVMVTARVVNNWWLALFDVSTGADRGVLDMDHGGSSSAPASISPGRVAIGMADPGEVCVLDIPSRRVEKCVDVPAPDGFDPASIPAVANGVLVIAAADGSVTALDIATWRVRWTSKIQRSIFDSRVAIAGDAVLGADWTRAPWALRVTDGSEIALAGVEGFVTATAADPAGGFRVAVRGDLRGRIERWRATG